MNKMKNGVTNKTMKKVLYRTFCFLSLVIAIYLMIDLKVSRTLDLKMIIVFILFFQILNRHEKVSFEEIGHFFENGYSTKGEKDRERGIGLYRAKMIADESGGEIVVGQEEISGENYIQFTVVI